jgi:hypothetical protein
LPAGLDSHGSTLRSPWNEGPSPENDMSEDHAHPITFADKMDYSEHDRTYERFLLLVKFGSIWVAAIVVGMAVGLVSSAGFLAGIFAFLLFGAVVSYFMK